MGEEGSFSIVIFHYYSRVFFIIKKNMKIT